MADDVQSIRSLNWRELFPFLNLFRSFRIAIHPSKLVLGFALLLFIYAGGRILDAVWPKDSYAVSHEIDAYQAFTETRGQTEAFTDSRAKMKENFAREYASRLQSRKIVTDEKEAQEAASAGEYYGKLQSAIVQDRNDQAAQADKAYADALKSIHDSKATEPERQKAARKAKEEHEFALSKARSDMELAQAELDQLIPHPLFDSFFNYEAQQFHAVVNNALTWNWFNGALSESRAAPPQIMGGEIEIRNFPAIGSTLRNVSAAIATSQPSVFLSLKNMLLVGPGWLLRYHFLFFIIFVLWFLLVWSLFGGALARVAAVHVARDEKISVRQALRFSSHKLLSYFFAPLIPLFIILAAGLLVGAGGLMMYISQLGVIVVGALFVLALIAGFVITLVIAGSIGGFNLMYPTIGVEGSDSFDAISRSFSYVFARPWRMVFYTILSLVYGSLCFLFVRFFVIVMLSLTQFFSQWFLVGKAAESWPIIFPPVNHDNLAYTINFHALAWGDGIGAALISIWVYIVLTLLASFVISFYFSATTVTYYLMRREVDATELDDVYLEDTDEDFGDAVVTTTTTTVETTTTAVATPAPPAN